MMVPIYPYHVNDVSVYQGKQRGRRGPPSKERASFCPKRWSFKRSHNEKRIALGSKRRMRARNASFRSGTPHPLCLLGRQDVIHVINDTRPSPSVFAYCKSWTVGRSGNEVTYSHVLTFTALTPPNKLAYKLSQVEYSKSML